MGLFSLTLCVIVVDMVVKAVRIVAPVLIGPVKDRLL